MHLKKDSHTLVSSSNDLYGRIKQKFDDFARYCGQEFRNEFGVTASVEETTRYSGIPLTLILRHNTSVIAFRMHSRLSAESKPVGLVEVSSIDPYGKKDEKVIGQFIVKSSGETDIEDDVGKLNVSNDCRRICLHYIHLSLIQ